MSNNKNFRTIITNSFSFIQLSSNNCFKTNAINIPLKIFTVKFDCTKITNYGSIKLWNNQLNKLIRLN